ncbi:hypothetical protein SUGI_0590190 [Cryptomeria japonica]|nr:hypothetical protein SUGI_0590190 [Cryptomeria japonica]
MAEEILKDDDQTFANRSIPVVARCIAYDASYILWSLNGPRWRLLRKICVKELFSTKSMEALQPLRREEDLVGELVYVLGVPNASDLFSFLDKVSGKSQGQNFLQSLLDLVERGVDEHDPDSVQLTMKDVKLLLLGNQRNCFA